MVESENHPNPHGSRKEFSLHQNSWSQDITKFLGHRYCHTPLPTHRLTQRNTLNQEFVEKSGLHSTNQGDVAALLRGRGRNKRGVAIPAPPRNVLERTIFQLTTAIMGLHTTLVATQLRGSRSSRVATPTKCDHEIALPQIEFKELKKIQLR